jgi:hypothetical protein
MNGGGPIWGRLLGIRVAALGLTLLIVGGLLTRNAVRGPGVGIPFCQLFVSFWPVHGENGERWGIFYQFVCWTPAAGPRFTK